jgi:hypothetical protein
VFNQRVVQKASFRSPEFIGFFAPISEIRAGPLPTVFWPFRVGLLVVMRFRKQLLMPPSSLLHIRGGALDSH